MAWDEIEILELDGTLDATLGGEVDEDGRIWLIVSEPLNHGHARVELPLDRVRMLREWLESVEKTMGVAR